MQAKNSKGANYAIKHLKANYKENAKKKANDYVEQQNMSKTRL